MSTVDGNSSDVDGLTNATFGEFNGYTRVSAYQTWIDSQMQFGQPQRSADVPEPSTWSAMATGLALAVALRRRRQAFIEPVKTAAGAASYC